MSVSTGRTLLLVAAASGASAALAVFAVLPSSRSQAAATRSGAVADADLARPRAPSRAIDATEIASGRIAIDRMPQEVAGALEQHSDVIDHAKVDAVRYAYVVYFQVSGRAGRDLVPISASISYRVP